MVSYLQSWGFVLIYQLTVPDLQSINDYHDLQPKYIDKNAATTILVHTQKESITVGRNPFWK